MHLTALSALVLLAPVLALPQETATASMVSSSSGSSDAESVDQANDALVASAASAIPSDYISVLETAVPTSWEYEMENPASQAAVLSAAASGIFPSWYNDLPASIKAVVSELGGFDVEMVGSTGAVTATAGPTSGAAAITTAAETTAATTASGSTGATTQTPTSGSAEAASSSKMAATSARSTGGAPIATGSIAGSVAGAVGLLGIVFAL
ncbi:hypothetical protein F1880_009541 [Penicillium rolfsii]|nr:hypothetical protein F1880_009541 [Penicillium rolfsii]